jgi:hypothetical protein
MCEDAAEIKKCQGVCCNVVKKFISHVNYKTCLFTLKDQMHEMYTESVRKIALSAPDDKRYIRADKISNMPLNIIN